MKHQNQHTSTRPASTPLERAVRKGTIRSRPRTRYTTDMDELELARGSLFSSVGLMRDGSSDMRSVANVQILTVLQEVFPSLPMELVEDVLITAQFRMDVAASMLGDISRSADESPERADLVLVDWAAVQSDLDMSDDDQWHEVSESRPEMQQWIFVQDEWEVIDDETPVKDKNARTYADVLSSTCAPATTTPLPQLLPVEVATSFSPLVRQKKPDTCHAFDEADAVSVKSFGARKRRSLRKYQS